MFRTILILLAIAILPACTAEQEPAKPVQKSIEKSDYMKLYKTTKYSFEDVADSLDMAIVDRGYKIDNHAYIGRMLARTGESLGITEKIYENAQQYRFCPASYSRRMLAADPHNIAFCPYIINFYNLPDDPKTVYVMFRRPLIVGSEESKAAIQAVEDLLDEIIKEALE